MIKTYVVHSEGNYGTIIQIVNANSKEEVREIVKDHSYTWPRYTITEISKDNKGIVYDSAIY